MQQDVVECDLANEDTCYDDNYNAIGCVSYFDGGCPCPSGLEKCGYDLALHYTGYTALNQSSAVKLMKRYVMMQIIIQLVVLPFHQMRQMDALVPLDKQDVVLVISRVALSFVVRKKRATIMRP
jgi:hypothetical protein